MPSVKVTFMTQGAPSPSRCANTTRVQKQWWLRGFLGAANTKEQQRRVLLQFWGPEFSVHRAGSRGSGKACALLPPAVVTLGELWLPRHLLRPLLFVSPFILALFGHRHCIWLGVLLLFVSYWRLNPPAQALSHTPSPL